MPVERPPGTKSDPERYRLPPMSVLLAFESAARQGNFSRAAIDRNTSQASISRSIAKLEEQLSVRLFDRSALGATLNDAGRLYYETILVGLEALHEETEKIRSLSTGQWSDALLPRRKTLRASSNYRASSR